MNDEISKNLLKQILDLWVDPEIDRRKKSGSIQDGFKLVAAQVVINIDKPIEVRLNNQVQAVIKAQTRRSLNKGEPVFMRDLAEIQSIELTENDPDAGHLTILLHEGKWFISFDFQYNAKRISEHLSAAKEFLDTSSSCLRGKRYRAFYENLFAATELIAKSWLLKLPLPKLLNKTKHRYIRSAFISHRSAGYFQKAHLQLYNTLEDTRGSARYLRKVFQPEHDRCRKQLITAREMYRLVTKSAPHLKRSVT